MNVHVCVCMCLYVCVHIRERKRKDHSFLAIPNLAEKIENEKQGDGRYMKECQKLFFLF